MQNNNGRKESNPQEKKSNTVEDLNAGSSSDDDSTNPPKRSERTLSELAMAAARASAKATTGKAQDRLDADDENLRQRNGQRIREGVEKQEYNARRHDRMAVGRSQSAPTTIEEPQVEEADTEGKNTGLLGDGGGGVGGDSSMVGGAPWVLPMASAARSAARSVEEADTEGENTGLLEPVQRQQSEAAVKNTSSAPATTDREQFLKSKKKKQKTSTPPTQPTPSPDVANDRAADAIERTHSAPASTDLSHAVGRERLSEFKSENRHFGHIPFDFKVIGSIFYNQCIIN